MTRLRVGIAGLGRMGRRHAENLARRVPNAELVAACDPSADELAWAQRQLDVSHCYTDCAAMLAAIETCTGDSVRTQTLDGAAVPVTAGAVAIGPPLRGGPWLAANGPADASGHRRSLIPIYGTPAIAQRFAIDWVKVSDEDKTFKGDSLKNESYYAEGVDALAVANGTVVEVKDSIPENVPGVNSRAVPITLETVGGNHVIIDIGGGYYAFYAHLKPGSLKVKLGDKVKRGQVVGHVGNTGNSTEPHLHFHVADANSPLGSEGVPYRLDSFEIVGHCATFGTTCQRSAPVTRKGEVPLENTLIRFP